MKRSMNFLLLTVLALFFYSCQKSKPPLPASETSLEDFTSSGSVIIKESENEIQISFKKQVGASGNPQTLSSPVEYYIDPDVYIYDGSAIMACNDFYNDGAYGDWMQIVENSDGFGFDITWYISGRYWIQRYVSSQVRITDPPSQIAAYLDCWYEHDPTGTVSRY